MKIGIRTFKSLKNDNVLIEADSKEAIEALNSQIRDICDYQLEINVQKRRNPRLIIYNVPDVVATENAEEIILALNPNLKQQEGDIQSKFIFKTKRNIRNLIVEVNAQTRRQLVQNKMKLEWTICSIDDYVSVNRCF
jgi:preprotein translocase subunit SecD